jgi:hypothetical protein
MKDLDLVVVLGTRQADPANPKIAASIAGVRRGGRLIASIRFPLAARR